jgi:hypothetical protein
MTSQNGDHMHFLHTDPDVIFDEPKVESMEANTSLNEGRNFLRLSNPMIESVRSG